MIINTSTIILYIFILLCLVGYIIYQHKKKREPLKFNEKEESTPSDKTINELDRKKMEIIISACDIISWDYDHRTKQIIIKNHSNFEEKTTIKGFLSMIHPDDRLIAENATKNLLSGKNETISFTVRYKDNTKTYENNQWKYGTIQGVPFDIAKDGTVLKYVGFIRDETKWQNMNLELKDYMSRINLINNSCQIIQWVYNIENQTINTYTDNSILQGVDFSIDTYLTYVHEDDRAFVKSKFDLMNKKEITSIDYEFRLMIPKYENYQSVTITGTAQYDNNGELIKYIGIRQNSTKINQLNKELEANNSKMLIAIKNADVDYWSFDCNSKTFDISYKDNSSTLNGNSVYTIEEYFEKFEYGDVDILYKNLNEMINGVAEEFNIDTKYRIRNGNGEWHYTAITGVPFSRDKDGKITSYTGLRKDNTVLVEAKLKLSHTNQLLETIINRIPCSLFLKDVESDYKYINANKGFYGTTDGTHKSVINKTDYDLFPKEVADKFRDEDLEIANSVGTVTVAKDIFEFDGEKRYLETTKEAFLFSDGRKLILGLTLDVTETKKLHDELLLAKNKAEQSDKLKSAFVANMSHEIRSPLNAIVGFSELILEATSDEERQEYSNIINTNNKLLLRLIGDILDLSKIESGLMEFRFETVDIVDYFNNLSVSMKQLVTNPNIDFIAINPYKKCTAKTDINRFGQVFTNFVTNSIKYTEKGFIKMEYECVDNGIKISVSDSGIGITAEKHKRVFSRFEKFDNFAQGTGLGLSICKAIIEALNGKIGFTSEVGVGSTFWAWVPCSIDFSVVDTDDNEKTVEQNSRTKPLKDVGKELNILVAEDNDSNYLLIKHILKRYNLTRAINGKEAVEFAQHSKFDVILMDMKMPIMTGIEATIAIRKFDDDILIFALTAQAFDSDKEAAIRAGCDDFLIKPINKTVLIETLEKVRYNELSCNIGSYKNNLTAK